MFVYWLMFCIPLLGVVMPLRPSQELSRLVWIFVGAVFVALIGFRHQVGADWQGYIYYLNDSGDRTLTQILTGPDPGYSLLNWISSRLGGGIYLVNIACGTFVMYGILKFCNRQTNTWLALLIFVPYMIIAVVMGYSRQGVALGITLLALVSFADRQIGKYLFYITLAALFHKSAILMLPLALLATSVNQIRTMLWVGLITISIVLVLMISSIEYFITAYIESRKNSDGAEIRITMNLVPAIVFLIFKDKLTPDTNERRLWYWLAMLSLICVPFVGTFSTAVDRAALFLLPLQVYVFSRLPGLIDDRLLRTVVVAGVITGYAAVNLVWLTYSNSSFLWIPYRMVPFL